MFLVDKKGVPIQRFAPGAPTTEVEAVIREQLGLPSLKVGSK